MRSHTECTHAHTPQARRTCRETRRYAALARSKGLQAQEISEGNFAQVIIWNPRDQLGLRLVWTRTYDQGGYRFFIITPEGAPRRYQGINMLTAWLNVLAKRA